MTQAPSWLPRAFVVPDARLTRVFQQQPQRCATVSEYAQATGIDVMGILNLLGPALDAGVLSIEPAGGEMFIHTAPSGRPVPQGQMDPPANLWEVLRLRCDVNSAFTLWQLYRRLQQAGWSVEARPQHVLTMLGRMERPPQLAVSVWGRLTPVVISPSLNQASDQRGPLTDLADAGAQACALVIPNGSLDDYVTATRSWYNNVPGALMSLLLLEAPSYAPVVINEHDAAVAPRAAAQDPRAVTD